MKEQERNAERKLTKAEVEAFKCVWTFGDLPKAERIQDQRSLVFDALSLSTLYVLLTEDEKTSLKKACERYMLNGEESIAFIIGWMNARLDVSLPTKREGVKIRRQTKRIKKALEEHASLEEGQDLCPGKHASTKAQATRVHRLRRALKDKRIHSTATSWKYIF